MVTGGAGALGSAIVSALHGQGLRVVVVDRSGDVTADLASERSTRAAADEDLGAWPARPAFLYASAAVLALGILGIQQYSEFIYFRF